MHREDQDRRIGGIDLAVGGRGGQVFRQLAAGGVDGRLHVLRGGVDVAVEVELQRDLRRARELVEVICDSPEICGELVLERLATVAAMVSGLAPGNCAVTWMVGKSTCGSGATGSSG